MVRSFCVMRALLCIFHLSNDPQAKNGLSYLLQCFTAPASTHRAIGSDAAHICIMRELCNTIDDECSRFAAQKMFFFIFVSFLHLNDDQTYSRNISEPKTTENLFKLVSLNISIYELFGIMNPLAKKKRKRSFRARTLGVAVHQFRRHETWVVLSIFVLVVRCLEKTILCKRCRCHLWMVWIFPIKFAHQFQFQVVFISVVQIFKLNEKNQKQTNTECVASPVGWCHHFSSSSWKQKAFNWKRVKCLTIEFEYSWQVMQFLFRNVIITLFIYLLFFVQTKEDETYANMHLKFNS